MTNLRAASDNSISQSPKFDRNGRIQNNIVLVQRLNGYFDANSMPGTGYHSDSLNSLSRENFISAERESQSAFYI